MAQKFTISRTHIPKQCWDYLQMRWRPCKDISVESFRSLGKAKACCTEGCCLSCKDLLEIANQLRAISAFTDAPFISPVPPVIPMAFILVETVIDGFNFLSANAGYDWEIEQGVGVRNIRTGKFCDVWNTFDVSAKEEFTPSVFYFNMRSNKSGCPDLTFSPYIEFVKVPGIVDGWILSLSQLSVCLNIENSEPYYDEENEIVVCKNCTNVIPVRCFFERSVISPLPSTIYYGQSYVYRIELEVGECCEDKVAFFHLTPNPYISLASNPTVLPIAPGTQVLEVIINANAGSGLTSYSEFLYIRAGCADTSISLKGLIDDLP